MRIFRVDNPHTKPFAFWEWAIGELKRDIPSSVPRRSVHAAEVMHRLAKLGFTQSYTYFAWRNTKQELTEYFTELAQRPGPRILPARTAGRTRPTSCPSTCSTAGGRVSWRGCVLAATLAANYGIYGPAFELLEHVPREPGSEEYLDSEKYQMRTWDLDARRQPARRSSRA